MIQSKSLLTGINSNEKIFADRVHKPPHAKPEISLYFRFLWSYPRAFMDEKPHLHLSPIYRCSMNRHS